MLPISQREIELIKMKRNATALLVASFSIFIITSLLEEQYLWLGFIRATTEAATVGAIADWFAVTALFRYPLGLKIPHTAIIPNRKQFIAEKFGQFVREKFLSEATVTQRLQDLDATRLVVEWGRQPQNSALIADRVSDNLAAAATVMRDEDIQIMLEERLASQIRSIHFAPILGHFLGLIMSGNRKREIFTSLVKGGSDFLKENKVTVTKTISAELPRIFRGLDKAIYKRLIDALDSTLSEVSQNPEHPLHDNFDTLVDRYIEEFKTSPEILEKEQSWKEELLKHPVFKELSISLWQDIKASLMQSNPNRDLRPALQSALSNMGDAILDDPVLFDKVDYWVRRAVVYLTRTYGHEVENLIATTIERWDAEQASREIELQVGKDLQFIRINGTIIGGLAGLIIYTASFIIKYWIA
ncbi:DUF445 domain-containing protein [Anaerolineales bacterium HSG24]|nr:DUF445 domain-containing protein [Anaerolineales bacterium HSG24]